MLRELLAWERDYTRQGGAEQPAASIDAVTTLIHSFALMLQGVETRLTERIAENASRSKERWERWELDFREYRDATESRLRELERHVAEERDLAGRRLAVLAEGEFLPGPHRLTWGGQDASGHALAAGVYLVRCDGETAIVSRKVAIVR